MARRETVHGMSPLPKKGKGDDESDKEEQVDESAPAWAQNMQRMMIKMIGKVNVVSEEVKEAKSIAKEAKNAAQEAKVAASEAGGQVDAMKEITILKGEMPKQVPNGGGKGDAKGAERLERRQRSMIFSNVAEDTKADVIKDAMWETLDEVKTDIEEVYTFSKHDSMGLARFRTTEGMWNYMQSKAGQHRHTIHGRTVFVKDAPKERAVRKLVRAIIECNGGDGATVKQDIDAKYWNGIVVYKDERVAEWNAEEQKMILKGEGFKYQRAYEALMEGK